MCFAWRAQHMCDITRNKEYGISELLVIQSGFLPSGRSLAHLIIHRINENENETATVSDFVYALCADSNSLDMLLAEWPQNTKHEGKGE